MRRHGAVMVGPRMRQCPHPPTLPSVPLFAAPLVPCSDMCRAFGKVLEPFLQPPFIHKLEQLGQWQGALTRAGREHVFFGVCDGTQSAAAHAAAFL